MNINDLMIGDWVYRPDCYDQVEEIRHNGVIGCDSLRGLITFSELEPIPITPEILENNGFEYDHYYHCWIYDEFTINYGHLLEEDDNDYLFIWVADISKKLIYVHELQHVLRLCNIEKEIEL